MENTTQPEGSGVRMKVVQVFAYLLLLFTLAQVLGFYSGTFIMRDARGNEVVQQLQVVSEPAAPSSVGYLFLYVLIGAALMYLLVRFYKGELLFILIEFAVVSFASSIVFYSFIKPFLQDTLLSMGISVILGLALGALKAVFPQMRNAAAVLATAGAGAVFGFSLSFYMALFFMVLLSIYDFIAVFKTKHMVEMATVLSKREMSFLVSSSQKTEKGEIKLELGTGDMLMPVILETSGFQISPACSAVVFLASSFSLFVLFILLSKKKAVLPALPIIAICNFIFLGAAKLLGIF
jgi:presenilin-like A22 family membrane protease